MEDAFWESSYSSYLHEDYLNILQNSKDFIFFKKQEELYNISNRSKKFKFNRLSKSFIKDTTKSLNINSLPIFNEDPIVDSLLVSPKYLNNFGNELNIDLVEDVYDSLKFTNYVHHLNFKNIVNIDKNILNPISYTQVLDNFRADYDDQQ